MSGQPGSGAPRCSDEEAEQRRTVLVVEDEWLVRMELTDAFADAGWSVLEASSGEEALRLLAGDAVIGMLVTDIRLTGPLTGWDVADAFRSAQPALPVIYATANPVPEGRPVDGSELVGKPTRMAELVTLGERLWRASP